jgi:hypothetical protein
MVPNSLPTIRKIPLRLMNQPAAQASVIGNCATWRCACGHPIALQGKSGPVSGPTRESAVVCDHCARVFFVIPLDRSFGPPVEVVELFALPENSPATATAAPSQFGLAAEATSPREPESSSEANQTPSGESPASNLTASESGP